MAGQHQQAIKIGKSIAAAAANSKPSFLWKEYVLASVAFLEGGNKILLKNRKLIAHHQGNKPNTMNSAIIDKPINNINKSYIYAN
ncbi:hypothetical protein [Pseudoalteromonas luteoviolacea]|nr:hypothetical protein [Pseudoalteromonas luteoviolacea]